MYRPQNIKIFEPTNPEYTLVDIITAEEFEALSPKMLLWCIDRPKSEMSLDSLDLVYGENDKEEMVYNGPYQIFGKLDFNPIITELKRLGVEQIEDIEIYVNIGDLNRRTDGRNILPGDIIRISYIKESDQFLHRFYEVSTVTPIDIYNFKYINWHLHLQQARAGILPDSIKNYTTLE
jgi:hypothetical protein